MTSASSRAASCDDPATIDVAPRNSTAERVSQRVHPVDQRPQARLLAHLIKEGDWQQVLVFTRTKHGANRLAEQLAKDGIQSSAIHGNKSQGARTRALADFKTEPRRGCWWPPTSPPAASTSTSCRTW